MSPGWDLKLKYITSVHTAGDRRATVFSLRIQRCDYEYYNIILNYIECLKTMNERNQTNRPTLFGLFLQHFIYM